MLTVTVCAALSAAGLAVSFLTAYRRRFVAATRLAAVSLLPIGLAMAGLIGLGGSIVSAVGSWAADLVFKPSVWTGFAVLGLAVVLYLVAGFAESRSGEAKPSRKERRAQRREGRAAESGGTPAAPAAPAASAPALPGSAAPAAGKGRPAAGAGEDFSDIEAILKKHGI